MKRYVFPSLAHADTAYSLESDTMRHFGRRHGPSILAHWAGFFQTFGDGLVQHSPDAPVPAEPEPMADYLASLATYLIGTDAPDDALHALSVAWPRHLPPSIWDVGFAMSIKHREDKTRYYSFSERKVSSAPAKQYDKRWHEIPDWANGGLFSCFRLCRPDYDLTFCDVALIASVVIDHYEALHGPEGYSVSHLLGLDWPIGQWANVRAGFNAVRDLLAAYEHRENAKRAMACYSRNLQLDKQTA